MSGGQDLPDQEEPMNEAFSLQLHDLLSSKALTLMRDFNHSDVCSESNIKL